MRDNRPKYSDLSQSQKKKDKARSTLNVALNRGIISKKPCFYCNNENVEAHHEDYNKPLEVIWVCKKHHMKITTGAIAPRETLRM